MITFLGHAFLPWRTMSPQPPKRQTTQPWTEASNTASPHESFLLRSCLSRAFRHSDGKLIDTGAEVRNKISLIPLTNLTVKYGHPGCCGPKTEHCYIQGFWDHPTFSHQNRDIEIRPWASKQTTTTKDLAWALENLMYCILVLSVTWNARTNLCPSAASGCLVRGLRDGTGNVWCKSLIGVRLQAAFCFPCLPSCSQLASVASRGTWFPCNPWKHPLGSY